MQRSADAALRFDAAIERAITDIARYPNRWPLGSYGTRRFLVRGFRYLLIYRERGAEGIQILAVAHASRRPGYWKTRL
jgi:plasmid stabilization system protein ParE